MTQSPLVPTFPLAEPARELHEIDIAREMALDGALDATFPASDPLSLTQPGGGHPSPRGIEGEPA